MAVPQSISESQMQIGHRTGMTESHIRAMHFSLMSTQALSTLQAEYMALSDASRECIARSHLYEELDLQIPTPVIYSDNQGALVMAQDPMNYSRMKHIELRYHFIRDCIEKGELSSCRLSPWRRQSCRYIHQGSYVLKTFSLSRLIGCANGLH